MAKKEITICDNCGTDTEEEDVFFHLVVDYGTKMDAAGSQETLYTEADFCLGCLGSLTHDLIHDLNLHDRKRWLISMNMLPE